MRLCYSFRFSLRREALSAVSVAIRLYASRAT